MKWLLPMVGDAQRLRKAEPVNQPYLMFHWYSDCAPGPNPEEAGLIPAWNTRKCPVSSMDRMPDYGSEDRGSTPLRGTMQA